MSDLKLFNEYQKHIEKFCVYPADRALEYTVLGLTNEAGEVAGKLKKYLRADTSLDVLEEQLEAELGDVLFYLSRVASHVGLTLSEIAEANVEKLESRLARGVIRGDGDTR
jgi:NTP pyrophosphatase (non-canonical NTP hydrolase)